MTDDRESERWADRLDRYEATLALERAGDAHRQALVDAGWREVGGDWVRPKARLRQSSEQIAQRVRKAVMALDPRRVPDTMLGDACGALAGCIEALCGLLVYDTTEETMQKLLDPDVVSRGLRGRRVTDPLRPRFRSVAVLVGAAMAPPPMLGVASGCEVRADGDKGRMRATWSEMACKQTRASTGQARNMGAVEYHADAQRALAGLDLHEADIDVHHALWSVLHDVVSRGKQADKVAAFREALALRRGTAAVADVHAPDVYAEATRDWSDKAIGKRLQRVRQDIDKRLGAAPADAERLAFKYGDKGMLAPRVGMPKPREKPAWRVREHAHVEPINALDGLL